MIQKDSRNEGIRQVPDTRPILPRKFMAIMFHVGKYPLDGSIR